MGTSRTRPAHLGVEGGVAGEGVLEGALADAVRKVAHEAAILRAGAVLPVGVPPRRRHRRRGRRSNPNHEQPNWNRGTNSLSSDARSERGRGLVEVERGGAGTRIYREGEASAAPPFSCWAGPQAVAEATQFSCTSCDQ